MILFHIPRLVADRLARLCLACADASGILAHVHCAIANDICTDKFGEPVVRVEVLDGVPLVDSERHCPDRDR